MLPEATVRHIDLAIRQHRSFALALMPGSELPIWFENGTCRELSPNGPLTDTPYSFEFSPWLGKFSKRGVIGKMPVSSEEMVFGGALYSGGSLHCMDAVRMRCLPAVFAVYGHSSGLQGDARAEGEERRQANLHDDMRLD